MNAPLLPGKIEMMPTDRLVPYVRNARTHSDQQVAQIAASMAEFGFVNPILIGDDARYERRSIAITANQPFGDWNRIFPDPAMTLAAVDRLVHHSTILELNVESYRRREALGEQRGPGRPASRATLKTQPD